MKTPGHEKKATTIPLHASLRDSSSVAHASEIARVINIWKQVFKGSA